MARFYGVLGNGKGRTSRCGAKTMTCKVTGEHFGVMVDVTVEDGKDVMRVYMTSGTWVNGEYKTDVPSRCLATLKRDTAKPHGVAIER